MSGDATTAVRLGQPDVGLLTMSEMVDNAARIADAVDLPVIADADTGYGGPVNVRRTVREYERAGVAAIQMEDQVWPKRCGHLAGKRVIPAAEMAAKVKAAVDSRRDQDFLIIARTDVLAIEGFQAALDRVGLYREAGADILSSRRRPAWNNSRSSAACRRRPCTTRPPAAARRSSTRTN